MRILFLVIALWFFPRMGSAQTGVYLGPPTVNEEADQEADQETDQPTEPVHQDVVVLTIEPHALYLAALGQDGGQHAGIEMALGLAIPIEPSWSMLIRARGAMAFDLVSPVLELDDTTCGGGFFTFCNHDSDARYPVGGELGIRYQGRSPIGTRSGLIVGIELLLSGTAYLNSYEHVSESGGVGGAANLSLAFVINERWSLGVVGGGRLEVDVYGGGAWAAAQGGLRLARHF